MEKRELSNVGRDGGDAEVLKGFIFDLRVFGEGVEVVEVVMVQRSEEVLSLIIWSNLGQVLLVPRIAGLSAGIP